MNKILKPVLIAVGLIAVLGVAAYFLYNQTKGQNEQQARTIEQLAQSTEGVDRTKTLIVGIDSAYPPMTFTDSKGSFVGFDVDLAKEVGTVINKEVLFVPLVWAEKDNDLNSDKIDVIWSGMVVTDERKQIYTITKPYTKSEKVALVSMDSAITSSEDFASLIVGTQKGATTGSFMKNFTTSSGAKVREVRDTYSDVPSGLTDLLKGEIDAFVEERTSLEYYNSRSQNIFREIKGLASEQSEIAVLVKKGNTQLADELSAAFDKVRENGAYQRVFDKWFK